MNQNPLPRQIASEVASEVAPIESQESDCFSKQDLLSLYMERPGKIAWMNLGHWFCEALGFVDKDVMRCSNIPEVFRLIESRGYNKKSKLNLRTLREYNKQFWER